MGHLSMTDIQSAFVNVESLDIRKGELAVLIGPSGAGKTTLLNIIAGFIPHSGMVLLNDRPIHSLPPFRRKIGYLFQDLYLFPHLTVFQNLKLAMKTRNLNKQQVKEEIYRLLDIFRISNLADHYPNQISGGEKQRVAMARSLACSPNLLLLDEPFSHLDYGTAKYLRHEFRQIQQQFQLTTLFVTHNLQEAAELQDRILLMERGTPRLIENFQELDSYWGFQMSAFEKKGFHKDMIGHEIPEPGPV